MPSLRRISTATISAGLVAASPLVHINAGTISGTTCNDVSTLVFRGIPFAQPPVGELRFMAPRASNASFPSGHLNATQSAPACVQMPGEFAWTRPSESEDCLYLDVYVPPGNLSGLPVKVWAHGGGNTGGATSYPLYDLCHMANDSIAVAISYRLGPFGFLGLKAAGIEGNMGLQDYVMALEWVQENIEAFGGDKTKVMLFGQSSGADDTYVISTLPQAKSLFSSAICESGGGLDLPPYETVQGVGANYASVLNCTPSDLSCLQSRSVVDLVSAYVNTPALYQGVGTFADSSLSGWVLALPNATTLSAAFVDGNFIEQQPLAVGPQVPIIMGHTGDDGTLFSLPTLFFSGGSIAAENYTTFLSQFGSSASEIAQRYPLSSFNASGSTATAVEAAITHIITQAGYTCFTHRGLRSALSSRAPTFAYTFNHTPSCPWIWFEGSPFPNSAESSYFGSTHTSELPFVLDNLVDQPFGNGTCNATEQEYALSTSLQALWTSMARSSDPGVGSNFTWPTFDFCSGQGLYVENVTSIRTLDFSECEFWDQIWETQGGVKLANLAACSNNSNSTSTSGSSRHDNAASALNLQSSGLSAAAALMGISFALLGL